MIGLYKDVRLTNYRVLALLKCDKYFNFLEIEYLLVSNKIHTFDARFSGFSFFSFPCVGITDLLLKIMSLSASVGVGRKKKGKLY